MFELSFDRGNQKESWRNAPQQEVKSFTGSKRLFFDWVLKGRCRLTVTAMTWDFLIWVLSRKGPSLIGVTLNWPWPNGCRNGKLFINGKKNPFGCHSHGFARHSGQFLIAPVCPWKIFVSKSYLALTLHWSHLSVCTQNKREGLRGRGKRWNGMEPWTVLLREPCWICCGSFGNDCV